MQKRVIRVGDEKQCAAHVLACEMKANGITGSAKEMSVPKITATTCMCTHDSVRGHTCTKTPQVHFIVPSEGECLACKVTHVVVCMPCLSCTLPFLQLVAVTLPFLHPSTLLQTPDVP